MALNVTLSIKKLLLKFPVLEFDPCPLDVGSIDDSSVRNIDRAISIYSDLDWQASVQPQDNWLTPTEINISGQGGKDLNKSGG